MSISRAKGLRSSSSFLLLLPHLPVTSIPPFIFPSIACCRRHFLRKMWPIQLAFRLLISCRIFLCSLTIVLRILYVVPVAQAHARARARTHARTQKASEPLLGYSGYRPVAWQSLGVSLATEWPLWKLSRFQNSRDPALCHYSELFLNYIPHCHCCVSLSFVLLPSHYFF